MTRDISFILTIDLSLSNRMVHNEGWEVKVTKPYPLRKLCQSFALRLIPYFLQPYYFRLLRLRFSSTEPIAGKSYKRYSFRSFFSLHLPLRLMNFLHVASRLRSYSISTLPQRSWAHHVYQNCLGNLVTSFISVLHFHLIYMKLPLIFLRWKCRLFFTVIRTRTRFTYSTTEQDLEEGEPETLVVRRSIWERRKPERYSPSNFCSKFSLSIIDDSPRTIREAVDL